MAYSAIANEGYLLQPKVIVENSHENKDEPQIIRKIANMTTLTL